ncbi:hypothetical protein GCM10027614_15470 [Micromonospora vulcania]
MAQVLGPFNIRAAHSQKCLDVMGGPAATGNGILIQQFDCLGAAQTNQLWYLVYESNGNWLLKPYHALFYDRCLDVIGGVGATNNGVRVHQFTCLGATQTNQRWFFTDGAKGTSTASCGLPTRSTPRTPTISAWMCEAARPRRGTASQFSSTSAKVCPRPTKSGLRFLLMANKDIVSRV